MLGPSYDHYMTFGIFRVHFNWQRKSYCTPSNILFLIEKPREILQQKNLRLLIANMKQMKAFSRHFYQRQSADLNGQHYTTPQN